jgi:hypothetical protein
MYCALHKKPLHMWKLVLCTIFNSKTSIWLFGRVEYIVYSICTLQNSNHLLLDAYIWLLKGSLDPNTTYLALRAHTSQKTYWNHLFSDSHGRSASNRVVHDFPTWINVMKYWENLLTHFRTSILMFYCWRSYINLISTYEGVSCGGHSTLYI